MRPYHQPLKEWIVGWEWMRSYHHSLKVNSWTRTWGWMSIYHQPLKEWIVKISDHNRKGEDTNDAITNLAIQWEVGDPFLFVSVGSLEEKKLTVSILERNNFKPMVCNTLLHVRREDFKVAITAHLRFEIFLILVEISPSNSNFSNSPRVWYIFSNSHKIWITRRNLNQNPKILKPIGQCLRWVPVMKKSNGQKSRWTVTLFKLPPWNLLVLH